MTPIATKSVKRNSVLRLAFVFALSGTISVQLYHALSLPLAASSTLTLAEFHGSSVNSGRNEQQSVDGFGACLMFKDDLSLLPEWLAYHFLTLPLRHVVVGLDHGNRQDPRPCLERYNKTDLRYTVWQLPPSVSNGLSPGDSTKEDSHHDLVQRQKLFVSECSKHLKQMGFGWTALIDSDEFVAPNYVGDDESQLQERLGPPSVMGKSTRQQLGETGRTVLDRLYEWEQDQKLEKSACLTLPRLLVGALENSTCNTPRLPEALQNLAVSDFSTLRFVQHAPKGDFRYSKFGKVLIDLSKIPIEELEPQAIRNIHRPSKRWCAPAVRHFLSSPFVLHHYIGSWEQYSSRNDGRRDRSEWERRAFMDFGANCRMREWILRFATIPGWRELLTLEGSIV